jgi:hypothetical protein
MSDNRNFFNGLVSEARALGVHLGVYTSQSQWSPIFGDDFHAGSPYPLWYAHCKSTAALLSRPRPSLSSDVCMCCVSASDVRWTATTFWVDHTKRSELTDICVALCLFVCRMATRHFRTSPHSLVR